MLFVSFETKQVKNTVSTAPRIKFGWVLDRAVGRWRVVHRTRTNIEDLETSSHSEECSPQVVHSTAGKLGMPTSSTAVEPSKSSGRAEQRVRTRESWQ